MKKTIKGHLCRLCAVIILCAIMLPLSACSYSGKVAMTLGNQKITINQMNLWLSRCKANINYSYLGGIDSNEFWDMVDDTETGMTNAEIFEEYIIKNSKTFLAGLHLFDELDLKLPEAYITDIDETLEELIHDVAEDSKSQFNAILSQYGVNYKILRDIYIIEAKIKYIQEYLYGSGAEKITASAKEEYYQSSYQRVKLIILYTVDKPLFETDEDGNDIYYTDEKSSTGEDYIAYDKTNGKPKYNENGIAYKDEQGKVIYYKEDGTISYDSENGLRYVLYDTETGYQKTTPYTAAEIAAQKSLAADINTKLVAGESFEALLDEYDQSGLEKEYPNGLYWSAASTTVPEIYDAVCEMKEGETKLVEYDEGICIVKKYELDEGGYGLDYNEDFFTDFADNIAAKTFENRISEYIDQIEVNQEVIDTIDIKKVSANSYY